MAPPTAAAAEEATRRAKGCSKPRGRPLRGLMSARETLWSTMLLLVVASIATARLALVSLAFAIAAAIRRRGGSGPAGWGGTGGDSGRSKG